MQEIYIFAAGRNPMGTFQGDLAGAGAVELLFPEITFVAHHPPSFADKPAFLQGHSQPDEPR